MQRLREKEWAGTGLESRASIAVVGRAARLELAGFRIAAKNGQADRASETADFPVNRRLNRRQSLSLFGLAGSARGKDVVRERPRQVRPFSLHPGSCSAISSTRSG